MKKWIRWWGVIVFICLTIFFSFLWFVLVDVVVEHGIERYGMDIVGAKVELDSADVTFFPLGIVLKRLQVTNPESPMTNVVDIARIKFSLDGLNLFRRKVTIDAMSLDEVKINTPRKTSGAITRKSKKAPKGVKKRVEEVLSLPSLKVPDIQEILEKEELRTLELVEKTRADIQVEKERYQKVLNEIPGKERLAQYEKRIDAIKSAKKGDVNSIIGGVSEVASIKKDIERDIRQIQDTQKGLKRTLTTLKGRMDEAVQAPQEDIRRLKSKYALSPEGIGNISRLLLGPRIGDWIDTAINWYEKLRPVLERTTKEKKEGHEVVKPIRGNGVNVVFKEHAPLPDFLIRQIDVSVKHTIGDLSGEIRHVTPDQDILKIPLTFTFSGDKLKGVKSAHIKGTLDHIVPLKSSDTVTLSLKGLKLQNIKLSDQKSFPMSIQKGLLNLDVDTALKGENITAHIIAGLGSVKFLTGTKEAADRPEQLLASALADVSEFTLKADIMGTLGDYKTDISSDLDRIMKDAIGNMVKKNAAHFEKRLESAIMAKVNGPIQSLRGNYSQLGVIDNELTSRLNQGNGILGSLNKKGELKGFKLPF